LESSLATALAITAIGMSLLFLALALFYGLLTLMMRIASRQSSHPASVAIEGKSTGEEKPEDLLRAAAIAVALARAGAGPGSDSNLAPGVASRPQLNPWWVFHHQRSLALNPGARRSR
jgi:Na+-transporting methylmalonyl-CoA/oxaloacetate decarboxylase gamma subunit